MRIISDATIQSTLFSHQRILFISSLNELSPRASDFTVDSTRSAFTVWAASSLARALGPSRPLAAINSVRRSCLHPSQEEPPYLFLLPAVELPNPEHQQPSPPSSRPVLPTSPLVLEPPPVSFWTNVSFPSSRPSLRSVYSSCCRALRCVRQDSVGS